MFKIENITIEIRGNKLVVTPKDNLTDEDIYFIKTNRDAILMYLKNKNKGHAPLVNIYGQRQCISCNYWRDCKCNHPEYTGHNHYGGTTHYTPDPKVWMRCKHHTGQITRNRRKH